MNENFRIHSIKHIDNCRRCLILLIVPQDFLFEDNCNSSKNPSSEILKKNILVSILISHLFRKIQIKYNDNVKIDNSNDNK